jgi:hypothetical protein
MTELHDFKQETGCNGRCKLKINEICFGLITLKPTKKNIYVI